MKASGLNDAAIAAFGKNFAQLQAGVTGMVGVGVGRAPAARQLVPPKARCRFRLKPRG